MPEAPTPKATTPSERSQYWDEVRSKAWELSRERIELYHELGVGTVAILFVWYFRGLNAAMENILTSLLYVIGPIVLYAALVYVVNFVRAMIRVPVYRQREIQRLTNEITRLKSQRLQSEIQPLHETEPITELHDDAIILRHPPIPHTVRLTISGDAYTEHTHRGAMFVRGRKIILQDVKGQPPLLDIARDKTPKYGAVVDYQWVPPPKDQDSVLSQ